MQITVTNQYSLELDIIPTKPNESKDMSEERKAASPPLFKTYNQNQQMLLPPDLNELIPKDHLVRVVSKTIDAMDIKPLIESYKVAAPPAMLQRCCLNSGYMATLAMFIPAGNCAKPCLRTFISCGLLGKTALIFALCKISACV